MKKQPYKYIAERKEAIRLMNKYQSDNPYAGLYGSVIGAAKRQAISVCNDVLRAMKVIPVPKENIMFWKRVIKEIKKF